MNIDFLEEPELEFGAGRHIDIRFGIMNYGPLDAGSPIAPKQINLGIVGTKETIEGVRLWFERCRGEILAKPNREDSSKPNKQPNLFMRFPGFALDTAFQSTLVMDDTFCRDIPSSSIVSIGKVPDLNERITRYVDLFIEEVKYLSESKDAKVIVCAVPNPILESMGTEGGDDEDGEEPTPSIVGPHLDFHDMLKARAMQQYRKPIQIILPPTYDASMQKQVSNLGRKRERQDEATRAWNIHTALYYKAEGVPWRLPRDETQLTACYIGVSFYKSLDKQALLTSVAQVFNDRGEGVVVRGRTATISKEDRQPHLPEEHARELVKDALERYYDVHKNFPARVVIHKSSQFDTNEQLGFEAAIKEKGISTHDFLWVTGSETKLYRAGKYPPLRGTMVSLDKNEMLLYTRGSVNFFETYPGRYVPVPLRIRTENAEQTQRFLAREILALSKMNWNRTQFDGAAPITLQASRKCSNILRYCSESRQIEPRYSFYM
jgi:hypothetical protein